MQTRRSVVNDTTILTRPYVVCLLYTSDAADDLLCVDLGGRRINKKNKNNAHLLHQHRDAYALSIHNLHSPINRDDHI